LPQILIVEDEPSIADTLAFALRADGFATLWRQRAHEALDLLRDTPATGGVVSGVASEGAAGGGIDFVILDVGLPDQSGFEACKALRRFSDVPVLFLTARGDEIDRIVGLEIGADDYVVKPFSPREVAARVRTILKRRAGIAPPAVRSGAAPGAPATPGLAAAAGLSLDPGRRCARFGGREIALTPLEYALLQALLARPRQVFSREQLLDALGVAATAGYDRTVDGHVRDLRAKLRAAGADANLIRTHRGFGYSYEPAAP
jgi:two-component system, OmpR family, catabolic regulation response regulator CreB